MSLDIENQKHQFY